MDKAFNYNRKLALKKLQEISNDCKIPLKIENIDIIGKKFIPLIKRPVMEKKGRNGKTMQKYFFEFNLEEKSFAKKEESGFLDELKMNYIMERTIGKE